MNAPPFEEKLMENESESSLEKHGLLQDFSADGQTKRDSKI